MNQTEAHGDYAELLARLARRTKPRIDAFYDFLRSYPYLGAAHPVGKALIKDIRGLRKITVAGEDWYRARTVSETKIYGKKDMEPPPADAVIKEGRFNHYGQSHFYLSESPELGAMECSHDTSCVCWIQKVTVNEEHDILDLTEGYEEFYGGGRTGDLPVLPLSVAGLLLSGTLTRRQKPGSSWKPEYFVPRFIADVCKHSGIRGIKYPSALAYGKNLVIFDFKALDCTFCGEPTLLTYRAGPHA